MAQARKHFGAEVVVRAEVPRAGAEMNVTPLIDILLVLLVIFMAALPITQKGLDINLPQQTQRTVDPHPGTIVVELTADRHLAINNQDVTLPELQPRLRELFQQRTDKTLYVIGAPTLRYRDVVEVIDAARGAGVARVGIVTERMRQSGAM